MTARVVVQRRRVDGEWTLTAQGMSLAMGVPEQAIHMAAITELLPDEWSTVLAKNSFEAEAATGCDPDDIAAVLNYLAGRDRDSTVVEDHAAGELYLRPRQARR